MSPMGNDEFTEIVAEALDRLPEEFKANFKNVEVVVEDRPSREITRQFGNRLILGLYQGTPVTKRTHYYAGVLPDKISIYREPILKISSSREDAINNIIRTLLHEVGHYFGINDNRLRELGY